MEYSYPLTGGQLLTREEIEGEAVLVEAAKSNPAAFEPLYQRHKERLYRYLLFRLGRKEDAADLTQQVFLKALSALPGYRARGVPFAAWLFRIASHSANDAHRRKKEHISWEQLPDTEYLLTEAGPETFFLQQERLAHLRQLLNQLDPAKRELLALRFSAGLSSAEIALVVGRSPAAVKKQLTRVLQGLKEHMR
jgi:RNA polymerase sigma-70 factor (ECF subfamily)